MTLLLAATLAAAPPLPPVQRIPVAPNRFIALRCMGTGPRTVLFESGGSDWSPVWALVQSPLASNARSCTYDRAGLGESDFARGPRSPGAIARDLHALIGAAKLGKVVLVGHSLGGFNAKLTAALYPQDIAGFVLLDPAEERTWDRTRDVLGRRLGKAVAARAELIDEQFIAFLADHYRHCAAKAATDGGLDLSSDEWKRCADPDRPPLGTALNADRRRIHATKTYQATQASEIAFSVNADKSGDKAYARLFEPGVLGDMPLTVLTHQDPLSDDPVDQLNAEQINLLHRETAALSKRGRHQLVANSGHYIQLDQPETVIAAVRDVLAADTAR